MKRQGGEGNTQPPLENFVNRDITPHHSCMLIRSTTFPLRRRNRVTVEWNILASDHRFRASMTDKSPSVRSWKLPATRWNGRSQQSLRQGYSHHEYYSRKDEKRCPGSLFNQTIISRSIEKGSFEFFSIEQSAIQHYPPTFERSAVNRNDLYFSIAETGKSRLSLVRVSTAEYSIHRIVSVNVTLNKVGAWKTIQHAMSITDWIKVPMRKHHHQEHFLK